MLLEENLEISKKNMKEIAEYYKKYLLEDMLKNWETRTCDEEFGGYITDFDRRWNVNSYNKGAWGQGRQIYTFSYVYELLDHNEKWLRLAKTGVDFVLNKMYAENGRFNYLVDREGNRLDGTISIFSDAFIIAGLAKYVQVTKDKVVWEKLQNLYEIFCANVLNKSFKDTAPFPCDKNNVNHSLNMISVNTSFEVKKVLGDCTNNLIDYGLNNIFGKLCNPEFGLLFENMNADGTFNDSKNAHLVNVGHTFETMWFCLEIAIEKGDDVLVQNVIKIAEKTFSLCKDKNGDSLHSFDALGENAKCHTWKYEIAFKPTDKVSWSYAEEMCFWAMISSYTKEQKYFERFIKIHNFIQQHFIDREFGDWFHALNSENKVIFDFKGSSVKSAYHMPRALMRIIESFLK